MDSPSFFHLITRESIRSGHNPAERRLVAVVYSVMAGSPAAARAVFDLCWPRGTRAGVLKVAREKAVGGRVGYIDLEIKRGRQTLWIEAKLDSGLSGEDQLRKYLATLKSHAGESRLVLVGPESSRLRIAEDLRAPSDEDDGPYFVSWQEVYAAVRETSGGNISDSDAWLTSELLKYFKREGLAPMGALTDEDTRALSAIDAAETKLGALVGSAGEKIDAEWRRRDLASGTKRWSFVYYKPVVSGTTKGWGRSTYFGWGFDPTETSFYAGVWFNPDEVAFKYDDVRARWLGDLQARKSAEWKHDQVSRSEQGAYVELALSDLVKKGTPARQRDHLATFVLRAFREVSEMGPPTR